jgi:hypothetical protein
MKPIDQEMQELIRKVTLAGGMAGFDPKAPEWVQRAFIRAIDDCPECQAEFEKTRRQNE